jgi:predicted transcriptional regulator
MAVRDFMSREITSLPRYASALDAIKFMTDMNVGSVVVDEEGRGAGIVTDRDIITKVMAEGRVVQKIQLSEIMSTPLFTVNEDEDILEVTHLMSEHSVRRFPVVNANGKMTGFIALDDILMFLGDEMQHIASALKKELGKQ